MMARGHVLFRLSAGTSVGMDLFDSDLYTLICESLEERHRDGSFEPFELPTRRQWLIREN